MSEDEFVSEYNERVLEIVDESLLLGEKIPESKRVRKVLWSLPGKFDMKAGCPTFLRKQKKNFHPTLSDENTDDSEENDVGINAFIVNITETDSVTEDESENSEEDSDNQLSFEQLKIQWKENSKARSIQKEKIQGLMEENEWLLSIIFLLKLKLREVQTEYDQTMKSVKMLNSESKILDQILSLGQSSSNKYGLGFDSSVKNTGQTTGIKFVPTIVNIKAELPVETKAVNTSTKTRLKTNLISVSQLWDQGYTVNFSKDNRVVTDENKRVLIEVQTWLWHRKLGHASLRCIDKVVENKAVIGILNIDSKIKFFCGDCQVEKQIKASHKSMKECCTNRVLELLHMDLMGPMQTESLGGKKYVFVAMDDFSLFTWIRFLKGKSDTAKTYKRTNDDDDELAPKVTMVPVVTATDAEGATPFQLDNNSLYDVDFKNNMGRWWDNTKQLGYPSFVFIQRLKELSKFVKLWQSEKMKLLVNTKKSLTLEIDAIDKLEEQNSLDPVATIENWLSKLILTKSLSKKLNSGLNVQKDYGSRMRMKTLPSFTKCARLSKE
ncbi:gag-pol polyprotein [Cucumis melo var. makuwa]|uniref:Gag-pol polyprotein n=1 Tax=Cucumis melo var. makuwa TaxID=1194695 RepID=A0A5D3DD31_CUCMM|nr:gag-pol polyprotein [Cucumis melo var. makuwa]TYK21435.1 gag-pol polyprotein [Cucumis melo var. makuwa]